MLLQEHLANSDDRAGLGDSGESFPEGWCPRYRMRRKVICQRKGERVGAHFWQGVGAGGMQEEGKNKQRRG